MDQTDQDLETPVQIDPRRSFSREQKNIRAGDLSGLPDQIAGAEMPPEIRVLEREHPEQERQREEGDQNGRVGKSDGGSPVGRRPIRNRGL